MPAFGLYTQIARNRRRSAFLIVGLVLLFYLMAFALALLLRAEEAFGSYEEAIRRAFIDSLWLMPFTTAVAAGWVWIGLRINTFALALVTGAAHVERSTNPRLYNLLENLCLSRGLSMPHLRIIETPALNAFASGVRPDQYTITITRGLLDTLDDAELEAVLAHELTHIRNGDVRMMIIAVFVVGILSFVGELIFRGLGSGSSRDSSSGKSKGGGILVLVALACVAISWGLSRVIRFTLSRQREYLADGGAVELTRNPDAMISALLKIEAHSDIEGAPSGVMEMCLDNPRTSASNLFATHPSIEQRIAALVKAGGRLPATQESLPVESTS
nr:M48 family metallopeptidase [Microvirga terricola]